MNLIICTTPFQVLMAEKIIDLYPNEKFYGIMIVVVKNEKFDYYLERFFSRCDNGFYLLDDSLNKISIVKKIILLRWKCFFLPKIDKVFFANLNSNRIQAILNSISFNKIETFDDGLGNLNGTVLNNRDMGIVKKIIKYFLYPKYSVSDIRNKSVKHYTVYKNSKNIIDNTCYLSLFAVEKTKLRNDDCVSYSILLGQPLNELCNNYFNYGSFVRYLFDKYSIEYYFPHPRETEIIQDITYLNTNLIIEDYILHKLQNEQCKFVIYTFFSGSVLSMLNLKNIEIISIKPRECPELDIHYSVIESYGVPILIS